MKTVANPVYGVIIETMNKKLLVVKGRATGKWSFPKGHRMEGETGPTCAMRELYEETGLKYQVKPSQYTTLSTGYYYLVKTKDEKIPHPIDKREIVTSSWMTRDQLARVQTNIDVSTFLRRNLEVKPRELPLPLSVACLTSSEDSILSMLASSMACVQLH